MSKTEGSARPQVRFETSMGSIILELFEQDAPKTVANFLAYVDNGHYERTIFHRVIEGFMVQCGGMDMEMNEKETKDPIVNEAANGVSNVRGTIAMARTPVIDSATAQFFINVADNKFLDHKSKTPQGFGYCVFGKVVQGMDIVDKINTVNTCSRAGHDDVPSEPVTILKVARA